MSYRTEFISFVVRIVCCIVLVVYLLGYIPSTRGWKLTMDGVGFLAAGLSFIPRVTRRNEQENDQ